MRRRRWPMDWRRANFHNLRPTVNRRRFCFSYHTLSRRSPSPWDRLRVRMLRRRREIIDFWHLSINRWRSLSLSAPVALAVSTVWAAVRVRVRDRWNAFAKFTAMNSHSSSRLREQELEQYPQNNSGNRTEMQWIGPKIGSRATTAPPSPALPQLSILLIFLFVFGLFLLMIFNAFRPPPSFPPQARL